MLIALVVFILLGTGGGARLAVRPLEREGNDQRVPLVLLGLLVIEATLYFDPNSVPRGIFHPGSGTTQLRLPEIYITLALVARLVARGKPTRIGLPAGLWLAFGAWMVVGAVEGELYHNSFSQNTYEAKDHPVHRGGLHVGRGSADSSVPRQRRSAQARQSVRWVRDGARPHDDPSHHRQHPFAAAPATGFRNNRSETAALFLGIGAMCFLVRLASGPARIRDVLALVPLVASVVLSNQRAVLVNLAVVVAVIVVALFVGHRHGIARRFHVGSGQVVLTLLAVVAVFIAMVIVPAVVDQQPVKVPLAPRFQSLFHNEAKAESAQDRLNLASEAESLIPQHLFIGWGLGVEFQFYETGTRQVQTIAYAHDIVLDLWLRLGLIGLLLFVAALWASLSDGLKAWRRHPEPATAALALATVAVIAGLLATALLEPLIDEYRFVTLLGVALGILRAASRPWAGRPDSPPGVPRWTARASRRRLRGGADHRRTNRDDRLRPGEPRRLDATRAQAGRFLPGSCGGRLLSRPGRE